MTYLKSLINKPEINLIKDNLYEIAEDQEIVENCLRIKIPKKQQGKFNYALIKDSEGVLVD